MVKEVRLRATERELLKVFEENPNQVLSRRFLYSVVLGYVEGTYTRTLDVHISRLRHKLEKLKPGSSILCVYGKGYSFLPNTNGAMMVSTVQTGIGSTKTGDSG